MFEVENKLDWCWYCDLTCQFVYDEHRENWCCSRCGRDLTHWGRKIEEDVYWRNGDGPMGMGDCKSYQRKHPRFIVQLPFDCSRMEREETYGGIATNASQGGLHVYLSELIEKGASLKIVILFIRGLECDAIKAIAKVVWGDLAAKVTWGKYRYGLTFESFNRGSLATFNILLQEIAKTHSG